MGWHSSGLCCSLQEKENPGWYLEFAYKGCTTCPFKAVEVNACTPSYVSIGMEFDRVTKLCQRDRNTDGLIQICQKTLPLYKPEKTEV